MLKAIGVALRSVMFALLLQLGLVYVFAIFFTQLLDGKNQPVESLEYRQFRSVAATWCHQAMFRLLKCSLLDRM